MDRKWIKDLTAKERYVIIGHYFFDLSMEDISHTLGITEKRAIEIEHNISEKLENLIWRKRMDNTKDTPYVFEHRKLDNCGRIVFCPENLTIGNNVDIGALSLIHAGVGVEIGDNVQIGGGCFIYSENSINDTHGKITIEEGATIGAQCTILPGVTIGKGAHIRANTRVNFDVEEGVTI